MHAHDLDLKPSLTVYKQWTKGPRPLLRFSKTGDHNIEDAYARHFVSPRKGSSSILVHSRSVLSNLDLVEDPQFAEVPLHQSARFAVPS
jgi:hypothetical protein